MDRSHAARLPLLVAGAALVVSSAVVPAHGAVHRHHLAVTGFQEVGDPNAAIRHSAAALTTIGVDGVNVSADGQSVTTPDAGARRAEAVAHARHLRAEFLVGNFGSGDFDETRAHKLLASPDAITAVVSTLVDAETSQGWDGISIDLEALTARDRAGLVSFLSALRAAMPSDGSLSISISNAVTPKRFRAWGYNLAAIGKHVDRVMLMAYDEHGSWENSPGPVGAFDWQKRGLRTVEAGVPRSHIDLGQAGYGYIWRPHRNYQVSDAQARAIVKRHHVTGSYRSKIGEWVAHLPDGSTMWWADARSYQRRSAYAARVGLHGLAVWSLGLSDPLT